eukprot:1579452-Prymnesium_polylepis.3
MDWQLVGPPAERDATLLLLAELQQSWTPICKSWCHAEHCVSMHGHAAHNISAFTFLRALSCGGCPACGGSSQAETRAASQPEGRTSAVRRPLSEESGGCATSCNRDASAGYCDRSLGVCVCMPGWAGAACDKLRLPACLIHEHRARNDDSSGAVSDSVPACAGFGGVMSCECARQCEAAMVPLPADHRSATAQKICFEPRARRGGTSYSSLPALGAVDYYAYEYGRLPLGFRRKMFAAYDLRRVIMALAQTLREIGRGYVATGDGVPVEPHSLTPLPIARCPAQCHSRGTCAALYEGHELEIVQCLCHVGFRGAACETPDLSDCASSCSGHGQCIGRVCLCDSPWSGLDCSLRSLKLTGRRRKQHHDALGGIARSAGNSSHRRFAPIFVYPMSSGLNLVLGQGNRGGPGARGMFQTNQLFVEQLHQRQDSIVAGKPTGVHAD